MFHSAWQNIKAAPFRKLQGMEKINLLQERLDLNVLLMNTVNSKKEYEFLERDCIRCIQEIVHYYAIPSFSFSQLISMKGGAR